MRTIPVLPSEPILPQEHAILCRVYGAAQQRCSQVMAEQQADIERLEGEVLRLRAAVMVRDTALAIACEDAVASSLERGARNIPALPLFAAAAAARFLRALRSAAPRWKSVPRIRQTARNARGVLANRPT